MEINEILKRYEGQYIKPTMKSVKHKPKGNDLQRVNLVTFNHNGKLSNHGGAL
jgi:hypothetical protein